MIFRAPGAGLGVEMVERMPFGMRTPVAVTYARCAPCGAFGEPVLDGSRLDRAPAAPEITSPRCTRARNGNGGAVCPAANAVGRCCRLSALCP